MRTSAHLHSAACGGSSKGTTRASTSLQLRSSHAAAPSHILPNVRMPDSVRPRVGSSCSEGEGQAAAASATTGLERHGTGEKFPGVGWDDAGNWGAEKGDAAAEGFAGRDGVAQGGGVEFKEPTGGTSTDFARDTPLPMTCRRYCSVRDRSLNQVLHSSCWQETTTKRSEQQHQYADDRRPRSLVRQRRENLQLFSSERENLLIGCEGGRKFKNVAEFWY
jgi:hypothetical protein